MKTRKNSSRAMNFESMEKRELFAADLGVNLATDPMPAQETAEIDFVEVAGDSYSAGKPVSYLKYKLDRCFIKSWSTSGDADDRPTEEVAFYYNKIAFGYSATVDATMAEMSQEDMARTDQIAAADASTEVGLLLPAVQAAREA